MPEPLISLGRGHHSCVIKSDVENDPEWLARIDYIGAVDQTRVYILITWFYHPEQIPPGVAQPRVKQNEVFLSDHEQVLETSTVECEFRFVMYSAGSALLSPPSLY